MTQNSEAIKVDIAIVGGGLAGLSLAAELAAPQFAHLKIIIIEPRAQYTRDKTWSYWRQAPHDYSNVEAKTWQSWLLADTQKRVQINSYEAESFIYASINSDAFYQAALAKINACSHILVLLNESVQAILPDQNQAEILLKSGSIIFVSQTIFDSHLTNITINNVEQNHLTQHFLGLEIEVDTPNFDENTVTLMDFQAATHGIHFLYVLPYSANRALVESTWICNHHHHDDYIAELQLYLQQKWPNLIYKTVYSEIGQLPLVSSKQLPCKAHGYWSAGQPNSLVPIIPIGSLAGTARASTGYAFLETLQDSKRLSNLIKNKQALTPFKRNFVDAEMDTLFLSFLHKNANLAPNLFVQLFSRCQPVSLIRFLSGNANWRDRLNVIIAMPKWPMLKHLLINSVKH